MEPGGICVTRTLPIDGAFLGDVLLRLRRDCTASVLRWTLGDWGAAEVDVAFAPLATGTTPGWTTTARLWSRRGLALTQAAVCCSVTDASEVVLSLTPDLESQAVPELPGLAELARAAVDELAEELLWYATRAGLPQSN